jgi:UDP-N-acetylmuramate--alanine ligase
MESVHFIGIGGSGLSAIARLLAESGWPVSGSDRADTPLATELRKLGVRVQIGHSAEYIQGAQVVVRSSAIPDSNPEVQAARAAGIPVLKRADFLGRLIQDRQGIAVAGTHGKTTTTAMIAWILVQAGLDPSYIIGGVSLDLGGNAHAGKGRPFVIEADEYDRMFLGLSPQVAVVTYLEHDHPDCFPTLEDYRDAFRAFIGRVQPGGTLLRPLASRFALTACAARPIIAPRTCAQMPAAASPLKPGAPARLSLPFISRFPACTTPPMPWLPWP